MPDAENKTAQQNLPGDAGAGSASGTSDAATEAALKKSRADAARAENLRVGRENKAQKKADEELAAKREQTGKAAEKGAAKAEKAEVDAVGPGALHEGAKILVRVLWMISGLFARIAGGRLEPLAAEDLEEGANESKALLKKVPGLTRVLSFFGLPLWLGNKVKQRFLEKKPETKPDNVHQLRAGGSP